MKSTKIISLALYGSLLLVPATTHAGVLSDLKQSVKDLASQATLVSAGADYGLNIDSNDGLSANFDANASASVGSLLNYNSSTCLDINSQACQSATDPGDDDENGDGGGNTGGGGNGGGGGNTGGSVGGSGSVSASSQTSGNASLDASALAFADGISLESTSPSEALVAGVSNDYDYSYPTPKHTSALGWILAGITAALAGGAILAKRRFPKLSLDTVLWPDE